MKWYHVIRNDNTVANPYVAGIGDLMGIEEGDLQHGKLITNWNEAAWIKAETTADDGDPDDALQDYLSPPIYSARLRKALDKAGIGGIQYLPLHVLRSDGTEIPGYAIANILNLVKDALDLERSDYDIYPADYFLSERVGKMRGLRIPVLRMEKLKDINIFRLAEYDTPIYVSQRFKDVFERTGCTGHSFSEINVTR